MKSSQFKSFVMTVAKALSSVSRQTCDDALFSISRARRSSNNSNLGIKNLVSVTKRAEVVQRVNGGAMIEQMKSIISQSPACAS
ncbi:MAG: hypothetical protein NE334_12605 [Lentisphaeraceae bacterium]|nr:hypothetical protein [Lentisphaeraceae bacterium]